MVFDTVATEFLQWGDLRNYHDYRKANPGQWFLGVLDTQNKRVYLLASDIAPPDQVTPRLNTYASKPPLPDGNWLSMPRIFGDGINSLPGGAGGLRQHGRVCVVYALSEADCLGFSMVKINNDFAQYRDWSNSLNGGKPGVNGYSNPVGPGAGQSMRMPTHWSEALKAFLRIDIPTIAASD